MTAFFNTGLTHKQFLQEYWQKKPLLIRQAFPESIVDFSADELAGLALENEVESRLVILTEQQEWLLRMGPFTEDDFSQLPDKNWTLLVQDIEKHLPELQNLLQPFRFIPDWRRDDLMVSYAVPGGSVGPHTDSYDVFLIQTQGVRRWQINDDTTFEPQWLAACDLRVLENFEMTQTWDLQPGDMLYLPPNMAHYGVAQTDCMTFSVGFRAPSQLQLLDAWVNTLADGRVANQLYHDADLTPAIFTRELNTQVLQRCKTQLHQLIEQADDTLLHALAELMTEAKPNLDTLAQDYFSDISDADTLATFFAQNYRLKRNPYQRCVWYQTDDELIICVAGERYPVGAAYREQVLPLLEADMLTHYEWQLFSQTPDAIAVLLDMLANGVWYEDDGD